MFNYKKAAAHVALRLTSESYDSGPFRLSKPRTATRIEIYEAIISMFEADAKDEHWESWYKQWLQLRR